MLTVVKVQAATATAADANDIAILGDVPESEALSSWWRDVRQMRLRPRKRHEPQPPAPRPLPAGYPRLSESTVDPRGTDSGVPSLVPPSATVSATTSEESRRAVPPVQTPARTLEAAATGTGILDVEVRLTIQEKLLTLVLASALGLKADRMADFTEQEGERLRQFQTAYDANRTSWFRGRRMPSIIFELVALRSDDTDSSSKRRPETSICIRGLSSEHDIRKFHEVMSRSAIRRLYSGLRLSYDKTLIQRPARVVDEEYDHLPSSLGETMCGTRLVTRRPSAVPWSSTIGGIIEVGGELYAITSSHTPDDGEVASGTASLVDGSSHSTLVDADYDDDVESALILDLPHLSKSVSGGGNATETGVSGETLSYFWPTLTVSGPTLEDGDDWRLIRLSTKYCFPNSVPRAQEHTSATNRMYLTESRDRRPSRSKVSIPAGFSGLCGGTLLSNPAFISIRGAAPTEVWTVVLDNNTVLQKGDSGSWAVDDQGCWVGTVTAMSGGDAYLIPARVQLEQIGSHFNLPVALASPLRCYFALAGDKSFPYAVADSFATKALTPDVLIASVSDMDGLARALATAETSFLQLQNHEQELKEVLRMRGNESYPALVQPAVSLPFEISMTFNRLKDTHELVLARGGTGSRAEIQRLLDGRKPTDDGDSWKPYGSRDTETTLVFPSRPTKENQPSAQSARSRLMPDMVLRTQQFLGLPSGPNVEEEQEENDHVAGVLAPSTNTKFDGRVFAHFIIHIIVVSGVSALAGMAALAAVLKVQPSLQQGLFAVPSPLVAGLGGLSLAAPLVAEDAIYRLLQFLYTRFPMFTRFTIPIFTAAFSFVVYLVVIFARSAIAVIVVSTVLSIDASSS